MKCQNYKQNMIISFPGCIELLCFLKTEVKGEEIHLQIKICFGFDFSVKYTSRKLCSNLREIKEILYLL